MVTRMRAFLLLNLCAMSFWHAASDPRCKVQGYYQSAPFIFSCAGSGGDPSSNKAQVRVDGGQTQEIVRVPQGTKEFTISLSGDASADLVVYDGTESVVPLKAGPDDVGGSQLHVYYKGVKISLVRSSGSPTAEKVTLSGAASPELSVRLVNHAASPSDFTLGFYYAPYAIDAAPCLQGGAPSGCKVFNRNATRAAVADWVRWLRTQYTDAETAWATLPLSADKFGDNAVPFYHWCQAWNAWPAATGDVPCAAAYKFATDGGLEANIGALQKEQFSQLWALPQPAALDDPLSSASVVAFDDQVSPAPVVVTLRPTPTPTLSPTPTPRVLGSPTTAAPTTAAPTPAVPSPSPSPGVSSPSPTPAAIASGTTCQGFKCPHPLTLRFQPEGLVCEYQVPVGCTKTVCCLQPVGTTTLLPEAAGEKPLARRRRRRRRRKHNQDTTQGRTPATYTTAPTPAPKVTQAPPVPHASLRVPTVFHYNETANQRCAGEPYTHVPSSGCDGWSGITPQACQEKCADSERAPNCPRRPCMAIVYYASSTWCHAFTADQCLTYVNQDQVVVYKKIPGGAPVPEGARAKNEYQPGQSTPVAQPALTLAQREHQMFHKKHIPFLVGGAVAGVAAGAAVMTGLGLMISSVHSPAAPGQPAAKNPLDAFKPAGPPPPTKPPQPSFKAKYTQEGARTTLAAAALIGATTIEVHSIAGFAVGDRISIGSEYGVIKAFSSIVLEQPLTQGHPLGASVKVAPQQKLATSTTTTTTTTTTMAWYAALSAGNSNGPMLPLACLFFVCLCGLVSLIIAAVLDPCKGRGKGRKVARGSPSVAELGGSVASVGSVGSNNSEWDYYDSDGYDSYGNSVAYTDNPGGSQAYTDASKYSQYGEYYSEQQQPLNKWGFPN